MFGIGFTEMLFVALMALIFLGPEKLPELGQKLGKFLRSINQARSDLNQTIKKDLNNEDDSRK